MRPRNCADPDASPGHYIWLPSQRWLIASRAVKIDSTFHPSASCKPLEPLEPLEAAPLILSPTTTSIASALARSLVRSGRCLTRTRSTTRPETRPQNAWPPPCLETRRSTPLAGCISLLACSLPASLSLSLRLSF
ncbi:hypothetical protein M431DRAFT_399928 [Trichoderma harzianum CBS 226.95]|uniref:Uncharacterized protein n=1 Tax=Trichoderma harzianum CBS 226.95 TaxID=983964 RepID=A0A2T4AE72_TRIHA|nr:hypothetical protein M431DRAFT_399928 [Trichoderma harzianum CBS 226.95]PTB55395.1 hypothetical protein M431DRAFT_399928 [Trichoderma harzianum CBS 226.95]